MSIQLDHEEVSVCQLYGSEKCDTVIEQFEQQVSLTPDATAIVFEDSELSFAQLDQLASQFSNAMLRAGIRRGDTVGLCIDRRPEAIASMLGAFKIGGVYVPLDPEYPADRVRYMIEDAQVRAVVTHDISSNALASQLHALFEKESSQGCALHWIDSATEAFANQPTETVLDLPASNELAYIMYTSGSTGMPKGVQIEHGSLKVYCEADQEIYELSNSDRTLQFSTLNFDIAIEEIFPPLLTGGVVVIRPQGRSASSNELSSIIDRFQVTAIHIATAYWHEWVDLMIASKALVPASLRLVIATGEKVSVEHYRRWKSLCRQPIKWCNAYGPTETTVTATVFIPDDDFDMPHMPIGKPLAGYEALILDDSNRPLGIGETGQLFIAGPALARGYHNNPAKTAAAFLSVDLPDRGLTRIYRTGDLARWLPSGDIEFAGRVDHQIKVGSYRIEPGEIEVAIAKFEGVLESIVVHEEVDGQKFLIAYVATGMNSISPKALQEHLRTVLPVYMVPPRYVLLASLPKTINGKIDRRSLPPANTSEPVADSAFIAPRSEMETKLAEVWQHVLHYPKIGVHDDFFALGGSSLLVTRVVTAITAEFDIELPVRDFFANPTIASISGHIERLIARKNGTIAKPEATKRSKSKLHQRLPLIDARMIPVENGSIFSVRYAPQNNRRNHAVLMCNSIGHEHTRAYRNLQQLALRLTEIGFDVIRFDYRGTGNSSGECQALTPDSMITDTKKVASYLRESTSIGHLTLLGIRLGATVAANIAADNLDSTPIDQLILWDPIVDGKYFVSMLDQFHRQTLGNQTRYSRVLKLTTQDQAYGHSTNDQKRNCFASLSIPETQNDRRRELILTSFEYKVHEPGILELGKRLRLKETTDHIYWHDAHFAERAFSSPDAFNCIIQFLANFREDTRNATQISKEIVQKSDPESTVVFGDCFHLVGVYNQPIQAVDTNDFAVLIMTAGMLPSNGPFRLHTKLAKSLQSVGIPSLRFDLSGIGDSLAAGFEGTSLERASHEISTAIDLLSYDYGINRVALFGLCSGADDALFAATQDRRIVGLYSIDGLGYRTRKFKMHRMLKNYVPKLTSKRAWRDRLTKLFSKRPAVHESLQLGLDVREFPERNTAAQQLLCLAERGVDLHFHYTGGVGDYYNYNRQFYEMFQGTVLEKTPALSQITTTFSPESDHVSFLVEHRDALIKSAVERLEAMKQGLLNA